MSDTSVEVRTSGSAGRDPLPAGVEENGPWWLVFFLTFLFLFGSAFAFLVHSFAVTF